MAAARRARSDTPYGGGITPTALVAVGDQGLLVRLGHEVGPETTARVWSALAALDAARPPWVVDLVPAYATLLVLYRPLDVEPAGVTSWVETTLAAARPGPLAGRRVTVPVWYDPEVGPDLEDVARRCGLPVDEVVRRHTGREVVVHMLGFKPGFPYMGELDPALVLPRLDAPRLRVPAGSVAIAGTRTGIYPVASPGGWRILGRTPWRIFDAGRERPFALLPGDLVRFEAVSAARYRELLASADAREEVGSAARRPQL